MIASALTTADTYFFLCNPDWTIDLGDKEISTNQDLCNSIKATISNGEFAYLNWSCANTKKIQVGDKAYLVRSSISPTGIIASGIVVEALEDEQLRNLASQYADLSAAYVDHVSNAYYVCLEIDSVVDFDFPLEQKTLKQFPKFRGINFHFQGGGKQFAPGNPTAIQALASEWEKHSLQCERQGRGRRLVNVFLEKGDLAKASKDYQTALNYYQQASSVDPNYGLAFNKEKNLRNFLERNKAMVSSSPEPPTVPSRTTAQDALTSIQAKLEPETSDDAEEEQQRVLTYIARRQGQTQFRQALLKAYSSKCAITGFDAEAALEAAHIVPYSETGNNDPSNGILLRADLHTLFDLNLLAIHPETLKLFLHPDLKDTEYRALHGQQVRSPKTGTLRPDKKFLTERLQQCTWLQLGNGSVPLLL